MNTSQSIARSAGSVLGIAAGTFALVWLVHSLALWMDASEEAALLLSLAGLGFCIRVYLRQALRVADDTDTATKGSAGDNTVAISGGLPVPSNGADLQPPVAVP